MGFAGVQCREGAPILTESHINARQEWGAQWARVAIFFVAKAWPNEYPPLPHRRFLRKSNPITGTLTLSIACDPIRVFGIRGGDLRGSHVIPPIPDAGFPVEL